MGGVVLQGAVSDREAMELEARSEGGDAGVRKLRAAVKSAAEMKRQGKGDDLMPRNTPGAFGTPITAARYLSLAGRGGADDMFSSDLKAEELKEKLGHVCDGNPGCRALLVFSGADEYVPKALRGERGERYSELAMRLCSAIGGGACAPWSDQGKGQENDSLRAWWHIIENGTHALDDRIHSTEFMAVTKDFLMQLRTDTN